jgi:hypothetical protein
MTHKSVSPLESGRLYSIRELRAAEATLPDQDLSVQDRKEIDWAKLLLADGLGLDDADTFRWTPAGAADFVIASGARTLNVQCTMAYDDAHARPRLAYSA